jgi:hypothetical protein
MFSDPHLKDRRVNVSIMYTPGFIHLSPSYLI